MAVDTLVDLLWPQEPPPAAKTTLQGYVKGLRQALEPARPTRMPSQVLVTAPPGYALAVEPDALDVDRFEEGVSAARRRLSALPTTAVGVPTGECADEARAVVTMIDEALGLWRGTPFLELGDAPGVEAERARLEELRLLALETRAAAALALGDHATVAPALESLVAAHPLRERLWALRALALVRCGRQGDALSALQDVRRLLVDELGIEPGAELRELQVAVLNQDPRLNWATPAASAGRSLPAEPAPRPTVAAPWPMVGRAAELTELLSLLDSAERGQPGFAAVVGEPGIGKSRLVAELARSAEERRITVVVGRCSQDEGAPPLWPWRGVLGGLGEELPAEQSPPDQAARFRSWERIARCVLEAATERTIVVVLEDLHWADVSSLRVLALMLEVAQSGRCVLVCTWRDHPEPVGALAAVAEGMARRHALRLHLTGLGSSDVVEVVEAVADSRLTDTEAEALRSRTDGNPFFLVEYARMVDPGRLESLLSDPHPPAAVGDVLRRRLERLPESTLGVLRTAAVIGRRVELTTLAAVSGSDEDDVLDALEPALAAGLVRDDGVDQFRFAHALVRDVLSGSMIATRRARLHARVAAVLGARTGHESEAAAHWLAAGPSHAGRAWRAATAAAACAQQLLAYDEAAQLLRAALTALELDPEATPSDRFDTVATLAAVLQRAGNWVELRSVVHRAVDIGIPLGDVERLARVAVLPSTGALWQAAPHGHVDVTLTQALRRVLDELPSGDGELRCRVMLSLSGELYYGVSPHEREALADEAVAMARRLGDPGLRMIACHSASVSIWRSGTAERRLELSREALELADELGDEAGVVVAATSLAVVACELGSIQLMEETAARARTCAERLQHLYALLVLDSLELPWTAMRGDLQAVEAQLEHLRSMAERTALDQSVDAIAGAHLVTLVWQQRDDEVAAILRRMTEVAALPLTASYVAFLARCGQVDEARAYLADNPIDLEVDIWFSPMTWGMTAEVALRLGDPFLGARAYERLAGLSGRTCSAGSGAAMGPMDAYAAMAAAAVGEMELAARHADRAEQQCQEWRIPLAAAWLRDQRDIWHF